MPTARPTITGITTVGLLAAHERRMETANDQDAPFEIPHLPSQSELLAEQAQAVISQAITAAVETVERELYADIRSRVAAILAESTDPAAIKALAAMHTEYRLDDDGKPHWTMPKEADPLTDDMGSSLAQLVAIGLANRAGIGVRWLVQHAREDRYDNSPEYASTGPASWADIGAVLGITPQAAAKRFGKDHESSYAVKHCDPVYRALTPVLDTAIRKRM